MNLSERLAKAAQDRRREHEASRRGSVSTVAYFTPEAMIEFESAAASAPDFVALPDVVADPVDANHVEPMKMRLPDVADEAPIGAGPLPLWERPLVDILHDAPLATVTSLPIVPHVDVDDDLGEFELAQPIPMRGEWMPAEVDVDLDDLHVPPLAATESEGLAGIALRFEHAVLDTSGEDAIDLTSHEFTSEHEMIDLDDITVDAEIVDDNMTIDLDDITVDAEIVEAASADALLDSWSAGVSAYAQDQQEKVDGLYQRMVDAVQRPRITFGPLDARDVAVPADVAAEHECPQCGAAARIDIHDPMRGRIHLSCDKCYKMWQEKVESTVHLDEPFMRD